MDVGVDGYSPILFIGHRLAMNSKFTVACFLVMITAFSTSRAAGLFGDRTDYTVGSNPKDVAAADLDADGDPDIIVANQHTFSAGNDSISILFNNGDGTFQDDIKYFTGNSPVALEAVDLDNDLDIDLAVVNRLGWNVAIMFNNGDGTFINSFSYAASSTPSDIEAADFDGDGFIDLAVSNAMAAHLSILINKGDGTFRTRVNYDISDVASSLSTADYDGDGDYDVTVGTSGAVDIMINNGNGVFSAYGSFAGGINPSRIYSVDFDGDNDYDMVINLTIRDSVAVFENNGQAEFSRAFDLSMGVSNDAAFGSDFDRDGDIDLAAVSGWGAFMKVFLNDGQSHFDDEGTYATGTRSMYLTGCDIDGDNDEDMIITNSESGTVSLYYNQHFNGMADFPVDTVYGIDGYADQESEAWIYMGNFSGGQDPSNMDPFSVTVNDSFMPSSFLPVDSYPDIPGDVIKVGFDLRDFIRSFGLIWDTKTRYYKVSGQFNDQSMFRVGGECVVVGFSRGDANLDNIVNVGDPVFLVDYLYRNGDPPGVYGVADADGDGQVIMSDIVFIINYIFRDGPAPQ